MLLCLVRKLAPVLLRCVPVHKEFITFRDRSSCVDVVNKPDHFVVADSLHLPLSLGGNKIN
jgi:hypothetical protein